jgi:hypothetical protein
MRLGDAFEHAGLATHGGQPTSWQEYSEAKEKKRLPIIIVPG